MPRAMNVQEILAVIQADPRCECILRDARPGGTIPGYWPPGWASVIRDFYYIRIYEKLGARACRNGWTLPLTPELSDFARYAPSVYPEELVPFFSKCACIGHSAQDGGDVIGVNLNPGPGYGQVFFAWMAKSIGYRCPLIADSIAEWLTLTHEAGPTSEPYFFRNDFVDRGPLIPNDPEYRGFNSLFDP
jgi:hypothetical protein